MTITVLVPDEAGVQALAGTDGVRALAYSPGAELPDGAQDAKVLVPSYLSVADVTAMVDELPNLDYVQLLSAGAEIWVGKLPARITLSTCRGAHGGSTAEWVVGALLAHYRDFEFYADARRRGTWDRHATETLQDKKVLVVGAGDLGEQLRRRLEPFTVTTTIVARRARDGVRGEDELPELLGEHDAVVLMVPLTEATRGMVDAKFLARMADRAILVNVARGPVVDTDALLAELNSGRLRAALDVTDPEPLPDGHPLWSAPGLFLTPHVGGTVTGHARRAWAIAAEEIGRYARGEQPRNVVRGEY